MYTIVVSYRYYCSGNFCEIAPTLCEILEQPCQNGGTCHDADDITMAMNDGNDYNGIGYICLCPVGFFGVDCEEGEYYFL